MPLAPTTPHFPRSTHRSRQHSRNQRHGRVEANHPLKTPRACRSPTGTAGSLYTHTRYANPFDQLWTHRVTLRPSGNFAGGSTITRLTALPRTKLRTRPQRHKPHPAPPTPLLPTQPTPLPPPLPVLHSPTPHRTPLRQHRPRLERTPTPTTRHIHHLSTKEHTTLP